MKSGGSNPFADDTDQSDESAQTDTRVSDTGNTDESDLPDEQSDRTAQSGQIDRSDLPRIPVRDSVKDDRDGGVHQLFVYEETAEKERAARRELEDRFGDLYKLDAREAIYLAGMQNLDDAEEILREWGADF